MKSRVISLEDFRRRRDEELGPYLMHRVDPNGCLVVELYGAKGELLDVYELDPQGTRTLLVDLVKELAASGPGLSGKGPPKGTPA